MRIVPPCSATMTRPLPSGTGPTHSGDERPPTTTWVSTLTAARSGRSSAGWLPVGEAAGDEAVADGEAGAADAVAGAAVVDDGLGDGRWRRRPAPAGDDRERERGDADDGERRA